MLLLSERKINMSKIIIINVQFRYVLEVSVTEEIVGKIGSELVYGFQLVPISAHQLYAHDHVIAWQFSFISNLKHISFVIICDHCKKIAVYLFEHNTKVLYQSAHSERNFNYGFKRKFCSKTCSLLFFAIFLIMLSIQEEIMK